LYKSGSTSARYALEIMVNYDDKIYLREEGGSFDTGNELILLVDKLNELVQEVNELKKLLSNKEQL
jgi:hypothetical protein